MTSLSFFSAEVPNIMHTLRLLETMEKQCFPVDSGAETKKTFVS